MYTGRVCFVEGDSHIGDPKAQSGLQSPAGQLVGGLTPARSTPRRRWLPLAAVVLVIVGALAWRAGNLDAFSLSNDEGAYLMWAWLAHTGHPLYSETVSVSAPAFIVLLDVAYDLAGVSLVSGRLVALACLAGLLATLTASGRQFDGDRAGTVGWVAGAAAATAFGVAPLAFYLSRMAMGEIPAMALATLAVWLTQVGIRRGHLVWLALSGAAFSLSLLTKAMNPLVVLPIGWLMVVGSDLNRRLSLSTKGGRGWGVRCAVWFLSAAAPVLACLVVYDPAAFYDQVIAFRFDLRAVYPLQIEKNLVWLDYFVRQHWGIVVWAVVGVALLIRRNRWRTLGALLLWVAGAIVTVLTHSPLFVHHAIILLPPLVLLAGIAAGETWRWWQAQRYRWAAWGLAGAGAFVIALPGAVTANHEVLSARFGREADAITLLKQVTRPGDQVISDNLLLAFMAGRQTPPPFGDLAQVAIDSHRQTSERLIAISQAYPVEAVANWALRLPYLDAYMRWVEDNYLIRRVWDNQHVIYFGRKVSPDAVPNPRRQPFAEGMTLIGFAARRDEWPTSQAATVLETDLYWQAERAIDQDYTVFVHLYDAEGRLVASHDGHPVYGFLPTSQWLPGQIVRDRHDIQLPSDLPVGAYRLTAGLYNASTGQRLRLQNAPGAPATDMAELITITLMER